ncbi:MAG: amidohydrolase family protein [Lachnospiraceae bacterium]
MIIDSHVHIGGEYLGFTMNEMMVTEMMERYPIDYAIVSNSDSGELDHSQHLIPKEHQVSQEDALQRTITFARKNPEKIGVAVWVKPLLQGVTKELEEMIEKNSDIICAIKLHPYHMNLSPTDEKVLPYLQLAKKYHLAVVSHTGGCEAAEPIHLYEAAKLFPSVPFVMVHMGLGTDNRAALDLLGKQDNLYGDTSWVPMSTTIEAIRRYGSKKMIFGSDAPIDGITTYSCNPKGERSIYQDYFHILPGEISKEAYDDLMYRNAIRIFGLEQRF